MRNFILQMFLSRVCWGLCFCGIILSSGCQEEEKATFDENSVAKLYCFTSPPYFHVRGSVQGVVYSHRSRDLGESFIHSVKQLSKDPDHILIADNPIQIVGMPQYNQLNQCGTYHIIVDHYGEVKDIPNFQYRGEKQVRVAQGPGWCLIITREDWGDAE